MTLDFSQKYMSLPLDVRTASSSPEVMTNLSELEDFYLYNLSPFVMGVMTKDISLDNLASVLEENLQVKREVALNIKTDLIKNVFSLFPQYVSGIERELDLEDIEKEARQIAGGEKDDSNNLTISEIIKEIIQEIDLDFSEAIIKNRFEKIIESYILGVRDSLSLKDSLKKARKVGGLEFDDSIIDVVMNLTDAKIKQYKRQIESQLSREKRPALNIKENNLPKINIPTNALKTKTGLLGHETTTEKKEPDVLKIKRHYVLDQNQKEGDKFLVKEEVSKKEIKLPILAKVIASDHLLSPLPPAVVIEKKEMKKEKKESFSISNVQVNNLPPKKGRVDLIDPVEEIQNLKIADLKRFDPDSEKALDRIKEKINFLEETSFATKVRGIKAWQKSEIYQVYVDIGRESLLSKKDVITIINERASSGRVTLSLEEFRGVMRLNQELKF